MQDTDVLDQHWRDEGLSRPLHRALTFSQAGLLVLGRGTLLAEFAKERPARGLALDGNEARVLSLLAAAHGEPVAGGVIAKIRRAGELWCDGEKTLAQIYLAFIGLPRLDEMGAYRLFLAGVALEKGLSPSDLMKALGFPHAARDLEKYNPDQPRVPAGSEPRERAVDIGRSRWIGLSCAESTAAQRPCQTICAERCWGNGFGRQSRWHCAGRSICPSISNADPNGRKNQSYPQYTVLAPKRERANFIPNSPTPKALNG